MVPGIPETSGERSAQGYGTGRKDGRPNWRRRYPLLLFRGISGFRGFAVPVAFNRIYPVERQRRLDGVPSGFDLRPTCAHVSDEVAYEASNAFASRRIGDFAVGTHHAAGTRYQKAAAGPEIGSQGTKYR